MKKIVICISGLPGCGKSTVAKKLAQKYRLRYISGGDALKELAVEAGFKPSGEDCGKPRREDVFSIRD